MSPSASKLRSAGRVAAAVGSETPSSPAGRCSRHRARTPTPPARPAARATARQWHRRRTTAGSRLRGCLRPRARERPAVEVGDRELLGRVAGVACDRTSNGLAHRQQRVGLDRSRRPRVDLLGAALPVGSAAEDVDVEPDGHPVLPAADEPDAARRHRGGDVRALYSVANVASPRLTSPAVTWLLTLVAEDVAPDAVVAPSASIGARRLVDLVRLRMPRARAPGSQLGGARRPVAVSLGVAKAVPDAWVRPEPRASAVRPRELRSARAQDEPVAAEAGAPRGVAAGDEGVDRHP